MTVHQQLWTELVSAGWPAHSGMHEAPAVKERVRGAQTAGEAGGWAWLSGITRFLA